MIMEMIMIVIVIVIVIMIVVMELGMKMKIIYPLRSAWGGCSVPAPQKSSAPPRRDAEENFYFLSAHALKYSSAFL